MNERLTEVTLNGFENDLATTAAFKTLQNRRKTYLLRIYMI
jgi:hypothetical protein